MTFAERFTTTPLAELDLAPCPTVQVAATVASVIGDMNAARTSCALVVDGGTAPVGIFTSRDVLLSVVDRPETWRGPIEAVMTPDPQVVGAHETPLTALHLMNEYRVRNLPVLDEDGAVVGNLTHAALLALAAELLRSGGLGLEASPAAEHELLFVDFRGMHPTRPVSAPFDMSLAEAVRQMQARGIGSLLLVDRRGSLVGVVTDRDLQTRVACHVVDLGAVPVGAYMTPAPVTLQPRDPIAAAVHAMAEVGCSHVPLVGATSRPVGMVSFRDLADYLETILAVAA